MPTLTPELVYDPETGLWSVWIEDAMVGLGRTEAEAVAEAEEAIEFAAEMMQENCS